MRRPLLSSFALAFSFLLSSSLAGAQPSGSGAGAPTAAVPAETVKPQTATTGKTDIAKGGFVTGTAPPVDDDPTQINDVSLGLGGLFSAGNGRTIAVTSLARARFRREEHQFSAAAVANFARAGKRGESVDTTVENFQGLVRYDHFLSEVVSLFLQSTARRDRFQGLDLRLNVDPGVAYYFIHTKTHRLQVEGGYDLQHDIRREGSRVQPPPAGAPPGTPPTTVDKSQTLHNARLFLGYENKLRKEVSFVASIEYLQNFASLETFRFIADIGLKSNVAEHLALATTYTARYENKPLPTVADLDSIASINLVYSFF
jgi:putative salt-induced outer membrane protein